MIDYKEISERYPKAFVEFMNTTNNTFVKSLTLDEENSLDETLFFFDEENRFHFLNHFAVFAIPTYFDTHNIHIFPARCAIVESLAKFNGKAWKFFLSLEDPIKSAEYIYPVSHEQAFDTRNEAMEAGIPQAFRIREQMIEHEANIRELAE